MWNTQIDADRQLDAYQLQNLFQGHGYNFPITNVIGVFTWAQNNHQKATGANSRQGTLSLRQIEDFLEHDLKHLDEDEENKSYLQQIKNLFHIFSCTIRILFHFGSSDLFIDTLAYVVAGLLLTVAILIPDSALSYYPHRANMDLMASVLYVFCSGKFVLTYPFREYRARVNADREVKEFKEDLLRRARIHNMKNSGNGKFRKSITVVGKNNVPIAEVLSFIEEELFDNDINKHMTKLDVEMLVFRYLLENYAERITDDIFQLIDVGRDRKVRVEEMHHFLCHQTTGKKTWISNVYLSLKASLNPSVFFSLSFALGSFISILKNLSIREKHGFSLKWLFGDKNPSFYSGWLFMIGCTFFVLNAYHAVQYSYEREVAAREIIKNCMHYKSAKKAFKEISKDGRFERQDIRGLFNKSVAFTTDEFDTIFNEIDFDGDGNITEDEIDGFLSAEDGRDMNVEVLKRCFQDFAFWAQFSWFIGTFGYLIPAYDGVLYNKGYFILGGVGYLMGGLGSLVMLIHVMQDTRSTVLQMKNCVSTMAETPIDMQSISSNMHRFKDDLFEIDTDEEALANEDDSYFKSSPPIASNSLRKLAILCEEGNTRIFYFIRRHSNTFRQLRLVGDEVTREAFNEEGIQIPIESFHSSDIDKNDIGGLVVFISDNDDDALIDMRTRSMHDAVIEKARSRNIALATNECSADMVLTSIRQALEERNTNLIPSFYMNGGWKVDTSAESRNMNELNDSVRGIESPSDNEMDNNKVSFRLFDSGVLNEDSSVSASSASC